MKHKSAHECRAKFFQEGISITEWATTHGFDRDDVYALLSGKSKGTRGKTHQIAVALGLKPAPQGIFNHETIQATEA